MSRSRRLLIAHRMAWFDIFFSEWTTSPRVPSCLRSDTALIRIDALPMPDDASPQHAARSAGRVARRWSYVAASACCPVPTPFDSLPFIRGRPQIPNKYDIFSRIRTLY